MNRLSIEAEGVVLCSLLAPLIDGYVYIQKLLGIIYELW